MSPYNILTEDARAAILPGMELGTLRPFMRGDRRGPSGAIIVARPRGGSSRSWLVPVREEVRS